MDTGKSLSAFKYFLTSEEKSYFLVTLRALKGEALSYKVQLRKEDVKQSWSQFYGWLWVIKDIYEPLYEGEY